MVDLCDWHIWRPTSKALLMKAEENMLKGRRLVIFCIYLLRSFSVKGLFLKPRNSITKE